MVLPSKSCLLSRGCSIPPSHPRCLGGDGDIDHTFMLCPFAKLVWFSSPFGINFDNVDDFCTWLEKIIMQDQPEVSELILSLCYGLRWARHMICFELKDIIVEMIVKKSYGMVVEYKCNTLRL
jgi:hypothetical protein